MLEDWIPIERINQLSPQERGALLAVLSREDFLAFMRRTLPLDANQALTDDQLRLIFGELLARLAEHADPSWLSGVTGQA